MAPYAEQIAWQRALRVLPYSGPAMAPGADPAERLRVLRGQNNYDTQSTESATWSSSGERSSGTERPSRDANRGSGNPFD